tara:strand:- start:5 stop:262 length:258 start_codon:yes stop_codon:yes gene_type:complete
MNMNISWPRRDPEFLEHQAELRRKKEEMTCQSFPDCELTNKGEGIKCTCGCGWVLCHTHLDIHLDVQEMIFPGTKEAVKERLKIN